MTLFISFHTLLYYKMLCAPICIFPGSTALSSIYGHYGFLKHVLGCMRWIPIDFSEIWIHGTTQCWIVMDQILACPRAFHGIAHVSINYSHCTMELSLDVNTFVHQTPNAPFFCLTWLHRKQMPILPPSLLHWICRILATTESSFLPAKYANFANDLDCLPSMDA